MQEMEIHGSSVLLSISKSILSRLLHLIWIHLKQWSQEIAQSDFSAFLRQTLHMLVIAVTYKIYFISIIGVAYLISEVETLFCVVSILLLRCSKLTTFNPSPEIGKIEK